MTTSSRCFTSNTNSAGVGTSGGASGNLMHLHCHAVMLSGILLKRCQCWILPETCTGAGLFAASKDWSGLWSITREKWCSYKMNGSVSPRKIQAKPSFSVCIFSHFLKVFSIQNPLASLYHLAINGTILPRCHKPRKTMSNFGSKWASVCEDSNNCLDIWKACFCLSAQTHLACLCRSSFNGAKFVDMFGKNLE